MVVGAIKKECDLVTVLGICRPLRRSTVGRCKGLIPMDKQKRTILVVDDDDSLRDSLRRTLHRRDWAVIEAAEGAEGLRIVAEHTVDVVLIDLFMPGKEGLETIDVLRRLYPRVYIIAMSGGGVRGRLDVLKAARLMGAQRTLPKPFARETLIEAVEQALAGPSSLP